MLDILLWLLYVNISLYSGLAVRNVNHRYIKADLNSIDERGIFEARFFDLSTLLL